MTEQDIKALAEQKKQAELVEAYQSIDRGCGELEMALSFPGIRNAVFDKYTNSFLESFVDATEKKWPEICEKYKGLYQKLADLVNAERAERAKGWTLEWIEE